MLKVDLNCDMGESFGPWKMGNDSEIMNFVSSVNIACGFHAGDATVMRKTAALAFEKGLAVGAHPGYRDLQGFGRRNMSMSPQEVSDIVLYQVSAMKGICESMGGSLHHVKPHGALYNQAARDPELACAIASAVRAIDPSLVLYGLSGSQLISEARNAGLAAASEVFADRSYQADGSLTPRSLPDALIEDTGAAVLQAVGMITEGRVASTDGTSVNVEADTICIHGDGANAVPFAEAINRALTEQGVSIRPPE
ncbi:MAG: LamB/YcsF family protein [Chloracidobacterium sp.]|nr:LamB/YcsF family protein [Chloracidobacterium sp.]